MLVRLTMVLRHMVLAVLCVLTSCQQPQGPRLALPDPAPVDGVGYLVFNAPITTASRDMFMADVDKLRNAGAKEIHVGMNSPGGDIEAAQAIVDYMARMHGQEDVTFKVYNLGIVASAATYVFLNAQSRYSVARGAFLFHAAFALQRGPVNAQNLHDQADKLDAYERAIRATLKARTRLTDAEAQTYVRRTVVLSSDDARRDGIVDAITAFAMPKGARSWVIAVKPTGTPAPGRPATPTADAPG